RGAGPGRGPSDGGAGRQALPAHDGAGLRTGRHRRRVPRRPVLRLPAGRRPAAAHRAHRRDLRWPRQPARHGLRRIRGRIHPGNGGGAGRPHLGAADPLRGHPAGPDHPAAGPDGQAVGGPAVTARRLFPSMTPARWAGVTVLVLLTAAFPLVESNQYVLTVIVTGLVLLVLNTSWNFVLGVAGVWNFGQLAIYALGGYGAGILMLHTPLPPWLAGLGGGVIAAVISILLAFPTLRLYGIYTSLLTFAFAEIVQYVILNDGSGLTGGSYGFPTVPGLYSSLSPDASMRAYYWTILGVVVASTAGLAAVGPSPPGIAGRAG